MKIIQLAELKNSLSGIDKKNLISTGSIELSRYDPPWTLPFLRRNEIAVGYTKNKAKEF